MLGTGYFLKIAKLIPSKKNQSVLIAKNLVPAKHKKSPMRKNKLPQKFRVTRYPVSSIVRYFYESRCILVTPEEIC